MSGASAAPGFADHFSTVARTYADFRPTYPPELFVWLASLTAAHDRAWDCACGNGQASADLARHFGRVVATDASAAQIAAAAPHPQITYRVAPAEQSGLDDSSADLVTVAQALHWFELERFYAEVQRVLKPGGVLAVWSYGVLSIDDPAIDALVQHFYRIVVGPYWPPERKHVENGYRDLLFPFATIAAPDFAIRAEWNLNQLTGYLRSWSSTARFIKAQGFDPVKQLAEQLAPLWGDPQRPVATHWPLAVRAGRR